MNQVEFRRMIRLPSIAQRYRPQRGWVNCRGCYEGCGRCLTHWWFCTICCSFVVISSFPRASAILDFAITLTLYFTAVRPDGVPVGEFLKSEFSEYHYATSALDVVIISFIRSIILYFCFAYRYQREGFSTPIVVSVATASVSSVFLVIKLIAMERVGQFTLLIFSLIYVWAAFILFLCVRRRRIRMRPPTYAIKNEQHAYKKLHRRKQSGIADSDISSDVDHDRRRGGGGATPSNGARPSVPEVTVDVERTQPKPDGRRHPRDRLSNSADSSTSTDALAPARNGIHRSAAPSPTAAHAPPSARENSIISTESLRDAHILNNVQATHNAHPQPHHHLSEKSRLKSLSTDGSDLLSSESASVQSRSRVPSGEYGSTAEKFLAEVDSQYIEIDGVNVHYRVERSPIVGVPDEEKGFELPVLLFHGFGGGVFSWRRVFPELAHRCTVLVAFDRPGFGLTEKPLQWGPTRQNPYSTDFGVRLAFRLMDYLQIEKAVMVGHSTGSAIACLAAIERPERVMGLICVSQTEGVPKFIRSILKTKLGGPIVMRLVRSEIGDVAIRRAWHKPDAIPPDVVRVHKESIRVKNWGQALLAMARVSQSRVLHDEHFSQVKCPVLVIHGDDDHLVQFSESQRLVRKFESCELVRIDDCGHIPHEECPSRFVVEVSAFLDKVRFASTHPTTFASAGATPTAATTPSNSSSVSHTHMIGALGVSSSQQNLLSSPTSNSISASMTVEAAQPSEDRERERERHRVGAAASSSGGNDIEERLIGDGEEEMDMSLMEPVLVMPN